MIKSKFIVVEGIDGSGKTSACIFVKNMLKQHGVKNIIIVHEPGGTVLSENLRKIINLSYKTENVNHITMLLLFYAARMQLIENIIKPALNNNTWVISDRHDLSSIAYQGGGFGIKKNIIIQLRNITIGDFYPDLTIFLDVIPKIGIQRIMNRGKLDGIEKNNINFFHRVRNSYLQEMQHNRKSITINTNLKLHIVQKDITNKLVKWLKKWI